MSIAHEQRCSPNRHMGIGSYRWCKSAAEKIVIVIEFEWEGDYCAQILLRFSWPDYSLAQIPIVIQSSGCLQEWYGEKGTSLFKQLHITTDNRAWSKTVIDRSLMRNITWIMRCITKANQIVSLIHRFRIQHFEIQREFHTVRLPGLLTGLLSKIIISLQNNSIKPVAPVWRQTLKCSRLQKPPQAIHPSDSHKRFTQAIHTIANR